MQSLCTVAEHVEIQGDEGAQACNGAVPTCRNLSSVIKSQKQNSYVFESWKQFKFDCKTCEGFYWIMNRQ